MAEFTNAQKQEMAQWIIDNQTQKVSDIETATDISAGGATIPVVQNDGTLRKYDIGSTLTRIEGAAAAETQRVSAETARVKAESERAANYTAMKAACEGAEKVNAQITNGTLIVTDRKGIMQTVNIGEAYESFVVEITSSVSTAAAAGTVVSVYLNNSATPLQYTADSDGYVSFTIARGTAYEIAFPDKAGCKQITPVTGTATGSEDGSETVISVEYEAATDEDVEVVTVIVRKRADGAYSAWSGATVHVKTGSDTADYTTDTDGKVTFNATLGTQYTVSMDEDTTGGYYIHLGEYSKTYTAKVTNRTVYMTWYEYRTGVFLIGSDGVERTADEWDADGMTETTGVLIKLVTQKLSERGGVIQFPIDDMAAQDTTVYPSKVWATSAMQTTSIDGIPNTETAENYYNGEAATQLIIAACKENDCEAPAAEYCAAQTLTVNGKTLTGYLPAIGQWIVLWDNRTAVDTLITKIKGDDVKLLSSFTANKWASTQNNANNTPAFLTQAMGYTKGVNGRAVPFYA